MICRCTQNTNNGISAGIVNTKTLILFFKYLCLFILIPFILFVIFKIAIFMNITIIVFHVHIVNMKFIFL